MSADVEGLFSAHHQQLFRYLYRAVGHRETARDLTQDVFVRVSRARVPDGTAPERQAWLFRIARNLLIDHIRRRARSPEVPASAVAAARPASQETRAVVREALAMLADLDRDVTNSEVISAFIDNEPFDADELSNALAHPDGRALLIELIALRSLAQPDDVMPVTIRPPALRTRPLHLAVAGAAVVVALVGGYKWGARSVTSEPSAPPAPARVVSAGAAWVETTPGVGR